MRDNWSFIWTPQFLAGTLVAGLMLNVLGAYVVRLVDRLRLRLPAYFRRAREEEAARVQLLFAAAASDNALYAALASEAARLRSHQLVGFFTAFVAIAVVLFVVGLSQVDPALRATSGGRLQVVFVIVSVFPFGFFQYISGLENGRRASRLDVALRSVQRGRALPIMD